MNKFENVLTKARALEQQVEAARLENLDVRRRQTRAEVHAQDWAKEMGGYDKAVEFCKLLDERDLLLTSKPSLTQRNKIAELKLQFNEGKVTV